MELLSQSHRRCHSHSRICRRRCSCSCSCSCSWSCNASCTHQWALATFCVSIFNMTRTPTHRGAFIMHCCFRTPQLPTQPPTHLYIHIHSNLHNCICHWHWLAGYNCIDHRPPTLVPSPLPTANSSHFTLCSICSTCNILFALLCKVCRASSPNRFHLQNGGFNK